MANNSSNNCVDANVTANYVYYSSFLTVFSSCLTIFGSCLIILTFILWKDIRQSVARVILLFLALADLGTGLGYLVSSIGYMIKQNGWKYFNDSSNDSTYSKFCTGTSFITTFFPVSSFFWTACLAIYFFVALVLVKPRWSRKLLIIFNLIAWVVPLIICSVAVSFGVLGESTHLTSAGWCFVALNGTKAHYSYTMYLLLEAGIDKVWEFLFFIIVIVCYSAIFCVNRKCCKSNQIRSQYPSAGGSNEVKYVNRNFKVIDWKLLLIPVVFIILRAPGTYRYLLSMSPSCHPNYMNCTETVSKTCFNLGGNYYILFLQALCAPLQGFGNAVLFVFLSKVIMRRLIQKIFFCRCFRRLGSPQSDKEPLLYTSDVSPESSVINQTDKGGNFYVSYSPGVNRVVDTGERFKDYKEDLLDDDGDDIRCSISAKICYGSIPRSGSISSVNTN